jgi:hypothetical protein
LYIIVSIEVGSSDEGSEENISRGSQAKSSTRDTVSTRSEESGGTTGTASEDLDSSADMLADLPNIQSIFGMRNVKYDQGGFK